MTSMTPSPRSNQTSPHTPQPLSLAPTQKAWVGSWNLVKSGVDHHLVVIWIRQLGKMPDRPGEVKHMARMCQECLPMPPVQGILSYILTETRNGEAQWTMSHASFAEVAVQSCGCTVVSSDVPSQYQ